MPSDCRRQGSLRTLFLCLVFLAGPEAASAAEPGRKNLRDAAPAPHHVRFVYVLPADGDDRGLDTNGVLARSVTRMQSWLAKETGGRRLRIVETGGKPEILFHRLRQADAELAALGMRMRPVIEPELHQAKLLRADEIYVFYYDGTGPATCGSAAWNPMLPGNIATKYLNGRDRNPWCDVTRQSAHESGPAFFDLGAVHEIFHVLGAVPACAPNNIPGGGTSRTTRPISCIGAPSSGVPPRGSTWAATTTMGTGGRIAWTWRAAPI